MKGKYFNMSSRKTLRRFSASSSDSPRDVLKEVDAPSALKSSVIWTAVVTIEGGVIASGAVVLELEETGVGIVRDP